MPRKKASQKGPITKARTRKKRTPFQKQSGGVQQFDRRAVSILFMEFLLVILFAAELLDFFGLNFTTGMLGPPKITLANLLIMAATLGMLVLLHLYLKKKNPELAGLKGDAEEAIRARAKQSVTEARNDPRVVALLIVELMIAFTLAISIYFALDEERALIPWHKLGIYPPITTILNLIILLAVLMLLFWMYSLTLPFRATRTSVRAKT